MPAFAALWLLSAVTADAALLDDFSAGLDHWSSSTSPEYYRGGQGKQGLTIESDGGRVLRAAFGFGRPEASEPIFITRAVVPPRPRMPIRRIRFRYRFEVTEPAGATRAPLDPAGGFKVRLRTGPTAFVDYDVPAIDGGWPVGRWVEVDLDARLLGPRVVNVYNADVTGRGVELQQVTFRLDDVDTLNARGALWLGPITFELAEETVDAPYTPRPAARTPGPDLRVLELVHSADGWYRFAQAALLADARAEVVTSRFRGLHFPFWEFPPTRDELLRYDVVVMADVDPWVMTRQQIEWLADAVHGGVGLLVGAGPNSLANAKRHPPALLELLPVSYQEAAKPVSARAVSQPAADHPLLQDVPVAGLGTVGLVGAVQPKPEAQVLLTSGKQPLLVAGQAGRGRVLVLNSWPQPRSLGDGSFLTSDSWPAMAARMLAWLAGREKLPAVPTPAVPAASRLSASWLYAKSALAPGGPFGLEVRVSHPDDRPLTGEVTARLEADGQTVWSRSLPAADQVRFDGDLPDLAAGPVTAVIALPGLADVRLVGQVVEPLRRADFFPLICYLPNNGGGHSFSPDQTRALVREVHDHGFNTIAVGNFGRGDDGSLTSALIGCAEDEATRLAMASILEYTSFTEYRRDRAYEVSPFAPEFEAKLRARVAKGLEQARYVPRLLSVKYVDEPSMSPANLDAGEATRAEYRRRTGRELVARQALGDDPGARYDYARFLSACLEQDFTIGQKLKTAAGAPWDLLVTFDSHGYAGGKALDNLQDAYRWTRPADRFDFDVYPYFYPASDRLRFVQANWCFACSRGISQALGKPWGFYLELDDRNYPYQVNPPEASAECAFTALAAGTNYLNSFILTGFGSGTTSRPERWAKTGEALTAIRRLGPLLNRWQRRPARVAVLWPETTQFIDNGYTVPRYTLSLLAQAYGEADVIHEEVFAAGPPPELDVLLILNARALRRDVFERLIEWVKVGHKLVFDRAPEIDERGRPLVWPDLPAQGDAIHLGQGFLVYNDPSLEANVARPAVENQDPSDWAAAVENLRRETDLETTQPVDPLTVQVTENVLQTDVGVRRDAHSAGLFIVNHQPRATRTAVKVGPFPFRPGWVVDLVSGKTLDAKPGADGRLTLSHDIPSRWAWLVGVWEQRPTSARVEVTTPTVERGGRLEYRVTLLAGGKAVRGSHLLELIVTGPDGRSHARLAGARATDDGVCQVSGVVPINAAKGKYRVVAEAPLAGVKAEGGFGVR